MAAPNRFAFAGGESGSWRVVSMTAIHGPPLAAVSHIEITPADHARAPANGGWLLHGLMSNLRYATKDELGKLRASQEPLGRPIASRAALIPIRKAPAWWDLAQDERRQIFEDASRHTAIGLEYLPAVARQLYHCRDLQEPFDFLTWFEYAPEDEPRFDMLVERLRASREWTFVEREVDIRLARA